MTQRIREQHRKELLAIMVRRNLFSEDIAAMLNVSPHTVTAWLKPESSKSSNPVPPWALELLAYKFAEERRKLYRLARKRKQAKERAREYA